ncbi:mannose-1-phosphate guanylyltransferase [Thiosulfatimonas sediminis]|uniref:Mannose-1-phosphate guanylyltransferase n=1 Tax=Thiosulfatimonas sediminis TaxID=2675054 RepID=A0A6F8PTR0_9GAMM|nr:nucleotidyltransferase family protein [Thiosulfatimonas sediminis]BBP45370.1 mannose-1-phosphate guanylyltransferase [Thiosulfatimonas sediminis]
MSQVFIPKAMILAAGRGKRLRPLTDTLPKPLVPLCQTPLIVYHLQKLAKAGVRDVVINHAWLGEQLEQTLGDGAKFGLRITYSPEPEGGLETAGGIINALPKLGSEPFLLINGDVYCDLDFSQLVARANGLRSEELLGHLMLVPSPEFNPQGDFGLQDGRVQERGELTFAGISVLKPQLFAQMEVDFIALAPVLRSAMREQQRISGALYTGFWSDIGTLERLKEAQAQLCPDCKAD